MGFLTNKFIGKSITGGIAKKVAGKAMSSGFTAYCRKTATAGIIASVGFTTMMFQTDAVYDIDQQDIQRANWEQRTSIATTIDTVKKAEEDAEGGGGGGGGGGTNIPGVMPNMEDWYTDVDLSESHGTMSNEVFDLGRKGTVPLYSNYPWTITPGTYVFNIQKANTDVVKYMDSRVDGRTTGLTYTTPEGTVVQGTTSKFTHEQDDSQATYVLDDVTCVRFAPQPCIVYRDYCDSFRKDLWVKKSCPVNEANDPNPIYGYSIRAKSSGDVEVYGARGRKYCVVLREKTNGNIYYLPLTASDAKAHTFPGGVLQTHLCLNSESNENGPFNLNVGGWYNKDNVSWSAFLDLLDTVGNEGVPMRQYFNVCLELVGSSNQTAQIAKWDIMAFVAWPPEY